MKMKIMSSVGNALLLIIVLAALTVLFCAISSWTKEYDPNEPMIGSVHLRHGDSDKAGALMIDLIRGWETNNVFFVDTYADGTLDWFRIGQNPMQIGPNSPDWEIWNQRYQEVRRMVGLAPPADPNEGL